MMLKTTGARLRAVRERLELSQRQLADLFGMKSNNAAVSDMELRDTPVKRKYLDVLREVHGVSPAYIQLGEGEMFVEGWVVNEPAAVYGTGRIDFGLAGVRARFQEQVKDYQVRSGLLYKDVAARLHINASHLSAVMGDLKDISLGMLLSAHLYGKLNLNYTASGEGGLYVGEENVKLVKRINELELVVQVLKENAKLKEPAEKKRSG